MKAPIKVYEGTDPRIDYKLEDELGEPFDLTPFTSIEWYVRDSTTGDMPAEPSRSTEAVPGGVTITDAAGGECQVQATKLDVGQPGNKWCFLVGVNAGGLTTMLSFRPLKVQGT